MAGRRTGSVITFRDHTELQRATGELATVRGLTETLRAQNHEASNRLHTVVSLIEMGHADEASAFATGESASAQRLADRLTASGQEPVCAALLLGKSAQASERGIEFVLDEDSRIDALPLPASGAVTILGNLIDNAFEAVAGLPSPRVELYVCADATTFTLEIEDSGPGVPEQLRAAVLERGWTSKPDAPGHGIGLALVLQVVRKHRGTLNVGSSELGGAAFVVRIEAP